ncbi:MAG: exosome complex exonuclease Rrp41 [Candidatus Aenigmatarchaeota archaeon]|nr:MAG: exosome complex exonuclease Rrp41 [Candidatus Aenigmarchaeota archaeon]
MKRADNRKVDELRPVKMKVGVLKQADGSAMVSIGKTIAIAAVYGPRELNPRHRRESDRAILQCNYTMAPFSTNERVRPGPSRRSVEISKVTREALEAALFLTDFPRTTVDLYIVILQANAGTRTAGINAASLALADAGIQMRDLVTSIAAGKIGKEYLLDLAGDEEEVTECDLPIAYMPGEKKLTLLQMDGDISKEDMKKIISLSVKGCEELYKHQRKALLEKWSKEGFE